MRFVQIQELQYTKNPKGTTIPQEFQKKTDWSTGKKKKIKIKVATECILLSNMWIKGCDGNKTFLQDVDFISHVEGRKY